MSNEFNETMRIEIPSDKKSVKEIIKIVYSALESKGYNPKMKEFVETIRHDWFETQEDELIEFLDVKNLEDFKTTKIFKRLKY